MISTRLKPLSPFPGFEPAVGSVARRFIGLSPW